MVMTYRLAPINLDHESWKRSKVKQTVRVLAHDCTDARIKAAKATVQGIEFQPLKGRRFAAPVPEKSPWELPDVTSCEPDGGSGPMPANDIVTEDGGQFPIHR